MSRAISRCATRRIEGDHNRAAKQAGFATAVVLGLVAVIGLLSVGALHDALFGEQLAGSRLLHQRAVALAEFGIEDGLRRLGSASPPLLASYALHPLPDSTESTSVRIEHLGQGAMPAGFSAARFALHHFEIESTGHVARGIRMTQVQGVTRMLPVEAPEAGIAE